jgi:hypothetical protein
MGITSLESTVPFRKADGQSAIHHTDQSDGGKATRLREAWSDGKSVKHSIIAWATGFGDLKETIS